MKLFYVYMYEIIELINILPWQWLYYNFKSASNARHNHCNYGFIIVTNAIIKLSLVCLFDVKNNFISKYKKCI